MNQQNKHLEKRRLAKTVRRGTNKEALAATIELRDRGWLIDGFLRGINLRGANLAGANLSGADLRRCSLRDANLQEANLHNANLCSIDLRDADLHDSDLSAARLYDADLRRANLSGANLRHTDFENARMGYGSLDNVDLSSVLELKTVKHDGPTTISVDTLYASRGRIPEVFLRGCGIPQRFIERTLGIFGENAIEFFDCFISYSHIDTEFARRLHDRLFMAGINCWRDAHDIKVGDFFEDKINQALRQRQRVIVCCSRHSLEPVMNFQILGL